MSDRMTVYQRGTGRTTRMMAEAIAFAKEGRAVYVLCATRRHADQLKKQYDFPNSGISFESAPEMEEFDWTNMNVRTAHPNCAWFVDHNAIETKYQKMLDELHRWDLPAPVKMKTWAEMAEAATVLLIDTYDIDVDRALDAFTTPEPVSSYDEQQVRKLVERKAIAMGLKKKVKNADQGRPESAVGGEGSAGSENRS